MSNKFIVILLILLVLLVGCNSNTDNPLNGEETVKSEVVNKNIDHSDTTIQTTTDTVAVAEEKEEPDPEEQLPVGEEMFENLVDGELLEKYYENINYPENYMMITTSIFNEMKSVTTDYSFEGNRRIETNIGEETTVMIYNAAEDANYQFALGGLTGVVTNQVSAENEDEDYSEYDENSSVNTATDNTKASIEEFNGEATVHIITEQPELAYKTYTWLSIEKGIPLKSETYQNDQLMIVNEVIKFNILTSIDLSLFQKPEGIEFIEYDISE